MKISTTWLCISLNSQMQIFSLIYTSKNVIYGSVLKYKVKEKQHLLEMGGRGS